MAFTAFGNGNSVVARGPNSYSDAAFGNVNSVTATGLNSNASTAFGDNNILTARGGCNIALAFVSNVTDSCH